MADLLGKILALIVGIPVFACTLGGTISIVWLLWLGEWKLALLVFFVAWVAKHAIAYLNLLPISISILGMKLMKKTFILGSPVFFFSTFLSFAISYIWICLVVNIILPNAHKIIMPYILFAFSMSMSPFLKMNDPSSAATTIHILSTLIGTFVLYLTILISGFSDGSFYKGANYMSYILLIGAMAQTGIAIYFEKNRRSEENAVSAQLEQKRYDYIHRWDSVLENADYNVLKNLAIDMIKAGESTNSAAPAGQKPVPYSLLEALEEFVKLPCKRTAENILDNDYRGITLAIFEKYSK